MWVRIPPNAPLLMDNTHALVAEMADALLSGGSAQGWASEFESRREHQQSRWRHSLTVRTRGSQPRDGSSILPAATISQWVRSSIGSSRGLLIPRLRVRIPPVPPSHTDVA